MDERDLVLQFIARMGQLTSEVGIGMAGLTEGVDLPALHRAVIQRKASRKWQLPSGTHYSIHGSGCYIRGKDGAVIDVDVASDDQTLIFDARRILLFADSIRVRGHTLEKMDLILQKMVNEGILTIQRTVGGQGWYAVAKPGDSPQ